jgi:hypothetical protein
MRDANAARLGIMDDHSSRPKGIGRCKTVKREIIDITISFISTNTSPLSPHPPPSLPFHSLPGALLQRRNMLAVNIAGVA